MTEQERLLALVPEGCYADAHAELLGYWQSSIEGVTEAAVQLKSSSLAELISITDAMDDAPAAPPQRVRGASDGSVAQGFALNILAALATCEAPAVGSPAP